MKYKIFTVLTLLLVFQISYSQTNVLKIKIEEVLKDKKAVVGVSILGNDGRDTVFVNGNKSFPMQSVFKFHIALFVLSEIDKGKFSLDQKIKFTKKDLLQNTWSPIRDKYPDGGKLSIAELIKYTVSQSDNSGCDILLKLIGGPQVVEDYFIKNNFKDISIKVSEGDMHQSWDAQYKNWTSPESANEVLKTFYSNSSKLLSKKSHDFIWKVMAETSTGLKRIKGQLPAGTVVAHKTGTGGTTEEGITTAVNDIGVVTLPDGKHFFISVFVAESKENLETNEKIIADIAKAAWDYYIGFDK